MRRLLRQGATLGLTLLFGVSLASSAFGWHGCPHHGGTPRGKDEPGASPVGQLDGPHPDAGHQPGPTSGACTCLGSCHAGAAPVLASQPEGAPAAEDGTRARVARAPVRRIRQHRPAYFLPFPHGPPALG